MYLARIASQRCLPIRDVITVIAIVLTEDSGAVYVSSVTSPPKLPDQMFKKLRCFQLEWENHQENTFARNHIHCSFVTEQQVNLRSQSNFIKKKNTIKRKQIVERLKQERLQEYIRTFSGTDLISGLQKITKTLRNLERETGERNAKRLWLKE
uniref:Uncharacterized protein n=1 Tax=Ditylenchus dipsaci TaxID=166011 RepID=A0A915ES67_9BILA